VLPASFTAHVDCDDGTSSDVTLDGGGGTGTPLLTVADRALCAVGDDISGLPPGVAVSYSVDGGAPPTNPPVFNVTANTTVSVTITHDASAVTTTTPTTQVPTAAPTTEPSVAPTMATLPPTGSDSSPPLYLGLGLLVVGASVLIVTTRRRANDW
jgi:LPXTG-motif cell wall-anchored protein